MKGYKKYLIRKTLVSILVFILITSAFIQTSISKNSIVSVKNISARSEGKLDIEYIYNLTEALSYIIFTEYNESEIARGRSFGSKGELKAAEIIEENMSALGLWTYKEKIENLPELPDVASAYWVNDYRIVIKNISSGVNRTVEGYIAPTWKGPRGTPKKVDHNFSYKNLKIKIKPKYSYPIGRSLRDKVNQEDYVFFTQDHEYNPNMEPFPIEKILQKIFHPYSDPVLFFKGVKQIMDIALWYKFYPRCIGLLKYDFNNDTYDISNSCHWNLPVVFINGSIGNEIMADIENHTLDFHLNQSYKKTVESYNVIGQINGTDPDKIVIIDCLYDGWWCQATADSAIGMSMVLAIAKWFKEKNVIPKYTIRFIGFAGEEQGIKGASYYQAIHKNENIIYVFDLNQLGFKQEYPKLHFDLISNNVRFLNDIFEIAERSNYDVRTGNGEIRKIYSPRGAPSDDKPFARKQKNCKTVCFIKGVNWVLHHRDGCCHTKGDVLDYFDPVDVNVTGEIILNIIRHIVTE